MGTRVIYYQGMHRADCSAKVKARRCSRMTAPFADPGPEARLALLPPRGA